MNCGVERVVYVSDSVLDIRELSSWVYADGVYKGSGVHVLQIQDKDGRELQPVLEGKWSVLAEGIATRSQKVLSDNYSHEVRVDAMYLPVRVLFKSWCQTVVPEGQEEAVAESRFWVRYVRA